MNKSCYQEKSFNMNMNIGKSRLEVVKELM
jgi:hypothetical protein